MGLNKIGFILAATIFTSCADRGSDRAEREAFNPHAEAHAPTSSDQQSAIDELVERVASTDYSAAVEANARFFNPFADLGPEASDSARMWSSLLDGTKRNAIVKREGLSSKELRRLSSWDYSSQPRDFCALSSRIGGFLHDNGGLPVGGREMFAASLHGDAAVDFQSMPEAQQTAYISSYIDPLTGRLWESLNSSEWSSLGVFFRRVPDEETITDFNGVNPIGKATDGCVFAFQLELTLWGDEPGEVLYQAKSGAAFPEQAE